MRIFYTCGRMMMCRGNYVGWALVILVTTVRYVGVTSASGLRLNVSKQTGDDETGIFHNSTLRNSSSENCPSSAATNSSVVDVNITSTVQKCLPKESDVYSSEAVAVRCITLCLGVWSVVANSLPLAAIIKQEHLHTPAYILTANLAASDVLNGIVFVIACSLFFFSNTVYSNVIMRRVRFTSILLSGLSSAYSLLALTAERYWFIVHGMTYVNNVTNDKCKVVIMVVWMWSVLLAILPNFGWYCALRTQEGCDPFGGALSYSYKVVFLVSVFIPIAAIVLLNTGVFWCLWKHVNAIAAQEATVGAPPSINRKSAITIVLITIVFLVGWLPLLFKMALFTHDHISVAKMLVFVIMNSAINPVIYAFRLQEVRRGVTRLFVNSNGNAILPGN
ncbi:melanocortin receptor 5-like [Branchiostoma lanceolatum]|uniref:melanocortin receptor 5-like n=1 Tax=Branchiostoma lanceolatum TaxID=7740 RepID=UPI0034532318